jgi:hypothetical protein
LGREVQFLAHCIPGGKLEGERKPRFNWAWRCLARNKAML